MRPPSDILPKEWERAHRVVDSAFRAYRNILDRGLRLRDQHICMDVVIDTGSLPLVIHSPVLAPLSVVLVSAIEQRTGTGQVLSGGTVTWSFRSGSISIHSVSGLAATTRYDSVIAVME